MKELSSFFPEIHQIPDEFNLSNTVIKDKILLNGEMVSFTGDYENVISPVMIKSNGNYENKLIGYAPLMNSEQALDALKSAKAAYNRGQGVWPTMKIENRIEHIEKFLAKFISIRAVTVNLLMWEIGKSFEDSCKEFDRTVEYIKDTIEALKVLDRQSSRFEIKDSIFAQIRRAPLGVVLCMGPFNYPINETFTLMIPALIMGNVVIFKPPKHGVLLYKAILESFAETLPPGVVNSVAGNGPTVISPLLQSGDIDVLAFIGSSKVGNILKKQHPKPNRLRCVLGLDAKNPAIILPDADIDLAVQEVLTGSLTFNGQRCTALKIIFVHNAIEKEFNQKLANAISNLKIGMPWEKGVKITPLPEKDKSNFLNSVLEDAKSKGSKVLNENGGTYFGSLYYPALISPVSQDAELFNIEQFGPLVPVHPFEDMLEPVEHLINSPFGQQVSLFSSDPGKLSEMIDFLVNQYCRVNINSQCQRGPDTFPFSGRKDSAEGTLSVSDALRVFSIRTLVAAKYNDLNKKIVTEITHNRSSNFLSIDFIL